MAFNFPERMAGMICMGSSTGERTERLEKVHLPTLVLQGDLDPLVQPPHGRALAEAVPEAQVTIFSNWGHGLDYPKLWPTLVEYIVKFRNSHPF
jgi:pimeloyl-ACP methyl ester carboxylesterase